jgi:hypothetical protein
MSNRFWYYTYGQFPAANHLLSTLAKSIEQDTGNTIQMNPLPLLTTQYQVKSKTNHIQHYIPIVDLNSSHTISTEESFARINPTLQASQTRILELMLHNTSNMKCSPYSLAENPMMIDPYSNVPYTHVCHEPLLVIVDLKDSFESSMPSKRSLPEFGLNVLSDASDYIPESKGLKHIYYTQLIVLGVSQIPQQDKIKLSSNCGSSEMDDCSNHDYVEMLCNLNDEWKNLGIGHNHQTHIKSGALLSDPRAALSSMLHNLLTFRFSVGYNNPIDPDMNEIMIQVPTSNEYNRKGLKLLHQFYNHSHTFMKYLHEANKDYYHKIKLYEEYLKRQSIYNHASECSNTLCDHCIKHKVKEPKKTLQTIQLHIQNLDNDLHHVYKFGLGEKQSSGFIVLK